MNAVLKTCLPGLPLRRGKVRDTYDLGNGCLLMVTTDRISAFDRVLPTGIPDKGRVLNQISSYWFNLLPNRNHMLSTNTREICQVHNISSKYRAALKGRCMLVRKCDVVPIECVVRGYLAGSAWPEYQQSQTVCGITLPPGLQPGDRLPEPIFIPATKAETGHDTNITFAQMSQLIGQDTAQNLRRMSISLYEAGAQYALMRGIIIADTKFEFGWRAKQIVLIDEVLTPDSSRFWPADQDNLGRRQVSFDKQFVRDWLTQNGWDKNSDPPALPANIVDKTRAKYIEAFERLTGTSFRS